MAPPLVKGRALARRRVAGLVFLVVIALLVELAVALYQKKFTDTVNVSLKTDHAGNQLSVHADVKVRGLIVGEVRKISSKGEGAVLSLALDPSKVSQLPTNTTAQLLPKTLFGEKEVALIVPSSPAAEHLHQHSVIQQDSSTTAIETERALNDFLPLLQSLKPEDLSKTLNALSNGLRGRGDQLGKNLALNAAYFRKLNPSLPTLAQDMAGLADLANNTSDATPNILATLDNLSFSSRSIVDQRTALDTFLKSSTDFAATADATLTRNEKGFVDLARYSRPTLDTFARYSPEYPCMLRTIAFQEIEGERTFGGGQPGLHITLEITRDKGGYVQGEEPKYKETIGPTCYGMQGKKIIPFPAYRNPQDGYRDSDPPEDPGTGPGHSASGASWLGSFTAEQAVGPSRSMSLPRGTTPYEALLIGPIAGANL
ncbi:MAG: hypothetical protein JWO22_2820 [Frankiales bacterium]|nr:hypothetical protein [Frankiales bacterium]